jgi:hypothetical protein
LVVQEYPKPVDYPRPEEGAKRETAVPAIGITHTFQMPVHQRLAFITGPVGQADDLERVALSLYTERAVGKPPVQDLSNPSSHDRKQLRYVRTLCAKLRL